VVSTIHGEKSLKTADYTIRVGTSQWQGWYYADVDPASLSISLPDVVGFFVVYSVNNRPNMVYIINQSTIRVLHNIAGGDIVLRVVTLS